jgi:predicted component of type VI protein secretion system
MEEAMKAIVKLFIAAMLVVGLAGCTTTKTASSPDKVKCALCEYTMPGADAGGPG